jgi:hypothetical protein
MAIVTVTFRNPVSDQAASGSSVDDTMTVRETIEHLSQSGFPLPPVAAGQHYVLEIKGKTELSSDDATLQSGGVKDGDVINVVAVQRGGRG